MKLIWPWQDRSRRFSPLKAGVFALMLAPAIRLTYLEATGDFGMFAMSFGNAVYWSGVWATVILIMALAVTPMLTIFRWSALIEVRRMIGVTALVYTVAHIIIYFALRQWNWAFILNETLTRLSLITATLSTIGLIALGATSLDEAIRRMGAKGWQRLHSTVYVVTALALFHVLLSRGTYPEQYLLSGLFFWVMAWRALNRYDLGADARALAVLALSTGLFAVIIEVWLSWWKRGYAPAETLANNVDFDLGVPPVWQLLAYGLLIALAAAGHQALGLRPVRLRARKVGQSLVAQD